MNVQNDIAALVCIFLLILLNGFFTLAKTALITVRHAHLHHMMEESERTSATDTIQALLREPSRVFASVQIGITLASYTAVAIAIAVLSPDVAALFLRLGVSHNVRISTILLTLIVALAAIIVGELVPYSYAHRYPERTALLVAIPMRVIVGLFSPLATIAIGISNLLVKPFGLTATFATPLITEQELRTLLEASAQSGAIEEDEKEIIRNVISFGDTDVRQVMTPRTDIKAADVNIGIPALVEIIVESGHSRIPIYEGNVDSIVGIIHAKDILPALARGERDIPLREIARIPLLVSENKRVDDLLEEFRESNIQLAIVQDEYGGTAGLVTIEDLLEELVGEIKDEYDTEETMIKIIDDDTSLLDGMLAIIDVNEELGLSLSTEDFDTIGGYVFGLFGHQPSVGETMRSGDIEFEVTRTDGRRVQEVRLTQCPPHGENSNGKSPTPLTDSATPA